MANGHHRGVYVNLGHLALPATLGVTEDLFVLVLGLVLVLGQEGFDPAGSIIELHEGVLDCTLPYQILRARGRARFSLRIKTPSLFPQCPEIRIS